MSTKYLSNAFLPSGGVEYKPFQPSTKSTPAITSPLAAPKRLQPSDYMSTQNKPLSPPQTRSPSAENTSAAMVEDWRTYTSTLRSQFKGEKAHMEADRARMEECMEEERALWELERSYFVAQVAELEAKIESLQSRIRSANRTPPVPGSQPMSTTSLTSGTLPRSAAHKSRSRKLSETSHASHTSTTDLPPQENGRDETGAPFYAPAPQNPARTWGTDANNIRFDSLSISEADIKVTAKELTASDFKQPSPGSECLSPIQEASTPSIDISHIQSDLEGVSIKASAVNPTFVARILSPVTSPNGPPSRPEPITIDEATDPKATAPARPSLSRTTTSPEGRAIKTLEVVSAPENRRLTMNAGHTPNHSLTKLTWLKEEDGEATPKPSHPIVFKGAIDRRASLAMSLVSVPDDEDEEIEDNGDRELTGALGLVGDAAVDNPFLAALTEKLEEVKRSSEPGSPRGSETSVDDDEDEDEGLEMPKLKIKPSMNFGRPMGRI